MDGIIHLFVLYIFYNVLQFKLYLLDQITVIFEIFLDKKHRCIKQLRLSSSKVAIFFACGVIQNGELCVTPYEDNDRETNDTQTYLRSETQ